MNSFGKVVRSKSNIIFGIHLLILGSKFLVLKSSCHYEHIFLILQYLVAQGCFLLINLSAGLATVSARDQVSSLFSSLECCKSATELKRLQIALSVLNFQ